MHGVECVVLCIGNKNGAPLVEVTCFFVEVTCFCLKSDLQMTGPLRSLAGHFSFFLKVRVQNGAQRSP